jgi:hypothetical protein
MGITAMMLARPVSNLIQSVSGDVGGSSTIYTITLPKPSTKGSTIIVGSWFKAPATFTSLIDSASQSYTPVGTALLVGTQYYLQLYYFRNSVAGVTTITQTISDINAQSLCVAEESNLVTSGSILDATAVQVSANQTIPSTTFTSGAMATSTKPSLVLYGLYGSEDSSNQAVVAGAGWTIIQNEAFTADGDNTVLLRRRVDAVGAYAVSGTCTAVANANGQGTLVAAFVPQAGM